MKIVALAALFVSLLSSQAPAAETCGLSGSLQERVASCHESTTSLELVFRTPDGLLGWRNRKSGRVFTLDAGTRRGWQESQDFCANLGVSRKDLKLSDQSWDLAYEEDFLQQALFEGFPELKRESSPAGRVLRFWMKDSAKATFAKWALDFSNASQKVEQEELESAHPSMRALCVWGTTAFQPTRPVIFGEGEFYFVVSELREALQHDLDLSSLGHAPGPLGVRSEYQITGTSPYISPGFSVHSVIWTDREDPLTGGTWTIQQDESNTEVLNSTFEILRAKNTGKVLKILMDGSEISDWQLAASFGAPTPVHVAVPAGKFSAKLYSANFGNNTAQVWLNAAPSSHGQLLKEQLEYSKTQYDYVVLKELISSHP